MLTRCFVVWPLLSGCSVDASAPQPRALIREQGPQLVVADDTTEHCSDVGAIRVCWGKAFPMRPRCDQRACVVDPTFPDVPVSGGWRCTGMGDDRKCRPRALDAGRFAEGGGRHVQLHPRLPDDGDWTCAETAGVVVCSGGTPAAGTAPSAPDPGWYCGQRKAKGAKQERVCVDFSPDVPDRTSRWECHFETKPDLARICVAKDSLHLLGDPCDEAHPCVDGARCVASRCLPEAPAPTCWFDTDCPNKACRFGTCRAEVK